MIKPKQYKQNTEMDNTNSNEEKFDEFDILYEMNPNI